MAKTLEQLLKQRIWSGEDAGQLYLYSAMNDIIHNRKEEEYDALFSQEFFDKVTKKIPFIQKDKTDYQFYKNLEEQITEIEQNFRYFNEKFCHYYECSFAIFYQIVDNINISKKIKKLNISDSEKEDILSDILTIKELINAEGKPSFKSNVSYKSHKKTLLESHKSIISSICFFLAMNITLTNIFVHIDFTELEPLLLKIELYFFKIENINDLLTFILENESDEMKDEIINFFDFIFIPDIYHDGNQEKMSKIYDYLFESLNFTDNPKELNISKIANVCIDIANLIYETFYNQEDKK